jgi:hypothetical protein
MLLRNYSDTDHNLADSWAAQHTGAASAAAGLDMTMVDPFICCLDPNC